MYADGAWDMDDAAMPTAADCIELTVCSIGDIEDKITTNLFNFPKVRQRVSVPGIQILIQIQNSVHLEQGSLSLSLRKF